MVNSPGRDDEVARRSSAFRFPAATSRRTSSSRAVSAAGFVRVDRLGPVEPTLPARAAAAGHSAPPAPLRDPSRITSALEERPPRPCASPRRAPPRRDSPSQPGAPPHLHGALQLEAPRLGDPLRPRIEPTGPPLPVRKLTGEPEMALLERERICGPGLLGRSLGIACQPRRLRSRRAHVTQALQVTAGERELERLVESRVRARIAASRAYPPERDRRADPADGVGRVGEHVLCGGGRVAPAAGVGLDQREPCPRVVRPQVVLVRVGDVLAQVSLRRLDRTSRRGRSRAC